MPSLGSDMEDGTLVEWVKLPGDNVQRGDVIAVVETQKGAIEIEVFESGVLETQLVDIGTCVPVGTVLARISNDVVGLSEPNVESVEQVELQATAKSEALAAATEWIDEGPIGKDDSLDEDVHDLPVSDPVQRSDVQRRRITPAAYRLASELGLDVTQLQSTGPEGAVVLSDVKRATEAVSAKDPVESPSPLEGMRSAISAAMARSKREIPHYYLAHSIDLTQAQRWLRDINVDRLPEERIVMSALLLKAVALSLSKYSEFNGFYENAKFSQASAVHAGMAINLRGGGLVAPAIHDTDKLDLDTVMMRMRSLVERVRMGRYTARELSDPTITVSSLGDRGVNSLLGVIYPPQVAIVGFGTPALRPHVNDDGALEAGLLVDVTLAADHRVSDGHRGALFLRSIQKHLESPEGMTT